MSDLESAPPLASLQRVEGETFTVFRSGRDDCESQLRRVTVSDDRRDGWERFTVRFEPADSEHLESGLYRVYNRTLGEFDVTISPTTTPDPDR